MGTETIRLNITLPKKIVQALDKIIGPRKRSHFISEAIRQKLEQNQKEKMEKLLAEGYKTAREESFTLSKEFEGADLEGWDDY